MQCKSKVVAMVMLSMGCDSFMRSIGRLTCREPMVLLIYAFRIKFLLMELKCLLAYLGQLPQTQESYGKDFYISFSSSSLEATGILQTKFSQT